EWAAIAAALAVTAIVGAAVAAAALRVSGPYLAMVTIAFGLIVEGVLIEWGSVTGGPGGIFNIPKPALRTHYWTVLAAAALALWPPRQSPPLRVGTGMPRRQEQRGCRGVARPFRVLRAHRRLYRLRGLRGSGRRSLHVPQRLHLAG